MNTVSLTVPGQPVPKQRARKGRSGWYTPKETQEYADRVEAAWMVEGRPQWGQSKVTLRATFFFAHSPSNLKKNGEPRKGAPTIPNCDFDNLLKAVTDPLSKRLYDDDRQIIGGAWSVRFVENGDEPRAELWFAGW